MLRNGATLPVRDNGLPPLASKEKARKSGLFELQRSDSDVKFNHRVGAGAEPGGKAQVMDRSRLSKLLVGRQG